LGPWGPPFHSCHSTPGTPLACSFRTRVPLTPFAPPRNYVDSRQAALIGSQGARLSPLPRQEQTVQVQQKPNADFILPLTYESLGRHIFTGSMVLGCEVEGL
jgi:hypothetical protein